MRKETTEAKLNRLFGLEEKAKELTTKATGKVVGVTEEEIQEFRAVQGLLYFLQAPELFTYKICGHCKTGFYVSRKYVGFCSYTCIKASLNEMGIKWSKGDDIEALAQDPQVYNGNEPIWISKPLLEKLQEMVTDTPSDLSPKATPYRFVQIQPEPLSPEDTSKSESQMAMEALFGASFSTDSTTATTKSTGVTSSKSKRPKRKVISVD